MKKYFLVFAALLAIGGGCVTRTVIAPVDDSDVDMVDPVDNDHTDEGGPYANLIKPVLPTEGSVVSSPVRVTGQARGSWYFEASFPVKVYDANGKLLGSGPAQAQSDWMTEDFVSFVASITFTQPTTATGKIVLENDNPSGLPENSKSVEIPVKF